MKLTYNQNYIYTFKTYKIRLNEILSFELTNTTNGSHSFVINTFRLIKTYLSFYKIQRLIYLNVYSSHAQLLLKSYTFLTMLINRHKHFKQTHTFRV